jgi:hypothetical protein
VGDKRGQQAVTTKTTKEAVADKESMSPPQQLTDDEPIYLPMNLEEVWLPTVNKKLSFELEVSSIVISTNAFGDFSKCTVISDLIGKSDMKAIVEDAQKLWQKFIHQPQTGRCLVFFLVLGKMCQQITEDYEKAIQELTSILKLDVSQHLTRFLYRGVLKLTSVDQLHAHGTGVV